MALVNKRIIDLPERSALNNDDYTVVDGDTGGTAKYNLANMDDSIDEVRQSVTTLSGVVTAQGQQLATTNQNVAQNTEDITDLKVDLNGFEDALGYVAGYSASKTLSGSAPYYVDIKEGVLLKAGVTYAVEVNLSTAPSNNPVYFYLRDSNDTNIFSKAFRVGDTAISGEINVNSDITVKVVAWAKVDSPTLAFSITPPPFELKIEDIRKDQTTFFEYQNSNNIFNKDSADIVTGKLINLSGSNIGGFSDNSRCFVSYIPITAGTYCWLGLPNIYGASAVRIAGYNSNKEYVKYFTGTAETGAPTADTTVYSFTFSESALKGIAYLGYTGLLSMRETLMFIKGSEYPQIYVPFVDEWLIPDLTVRTDQIANIEDYATNILSGKTIVFDGDSICNANSEIDSADPDGNLGNANNRGWCYRVGHPNNMTYYNLGRGGGTITYVDANRHCISRDIDTIHTTYPNLDYLILEGGTNDADLLSDDKIGTMSDTDYSGSYDDTTFIGALETLFYKAENYYPHARIGFIVAQKMGGVQSASSRARRYLFFEKAMDVCKKWGVPYINLWDDTILNPMFVPMYDPNKTAQENREAGSLYIDGQHLTAYGYDAISPKIASWIRSL